MTHIVFLTRGHGYGHAAVDVPVIRALRDLRPSVTVEAASYGTGLEHYARQGMPCADLRIDDVNDQGAEAALRVTAFLRSRKSADLVVAHEVFAAPAVCGMLGLRSVLLTHWFFSEVGLPERDEVLRAAKSLLVLDFPQAHVVPSGLAGQVTFVGAVAKRFDLDRAAARRVLGVGAAERVVVVTAGAVTPYNARQLETLESRAVAACAGWAKPFVLAGSRRVSRPEIYYAAADVVVANATFATLCTLVRNGVPTVAVVGEGNPVDRLHTEFFAREGLLRLVEGVELSEEALRSALSSAATAATAATAVKPRSSLPWAEPHDLARLLLQRLGECQPDVRRSESGDQ
ncbi:hypothetical protein [Flindersiella endophytica]